MSLSLSSRLTHAQSTQSTDLELSAELVQLLEHDLGRVLHVLRLQAAELAGLPLVPVGVPLLADLPYLLQVVQVLEEHTHTRTRMYTPSDIRWI